MDPAEPKEFDFFVCHAGEDNDTAASPIGVGLQNAGYTVWVDKGKLHVGDRLLRVINEGISRSRFGVVILSRAFFAKNWSQWEVEGLAAIEDAENRKVILPVWHGITKEEVARFAPILAARYAAETKNGNDRVIEELIAAFEAERPNVAALPSTGLPTDDEGPGPLDLFAEAEEGYETGSNAVVQISTSMSTLKERVTAFNARNHELAEEIKRTRQALPWKTLRNLVNEIVPIFDDHVNTLREQSGRMRQAFARAFLSAARGFALESGPAADEARVRHSAIISNISTAALGAAKVMESIRSTVDGLQGFSSDMKKARRRMLTALDEQIAAIYGVIDDAEDARKLLLKIP